MVAAITVGLSRAWPLGDCVRLGTATATAMLMTPGTPAVMPNVDALRASSGDY